MKSILIVAATIEEITPLLKSMGSDVLRLRRIDIGNITISVAVTGVGIASSAFNLGQLLAQKEYELVINAGLAGSYSHKNNISDVVVVSHDRFADLGVEDEYRFIPSHNLAFTDGNIKPYLSSGWLAPEVPGLKVLQSIKHVRAITSDTVHTLKSSVKSMIELYQPDIESMEGAAVFFACLGTETPVLQIRAISNFVGPRTRENWKASEAIQNLNKTLIAIIDELKT